MGVYNKKERTTSRPIMPELIDRRLERTRFLKDLQTKKAFTSREADKAISKLESLFENKQIDKNTFSQYRREVISKVSNEGKIDRRAPTQQIIYTERPTRKYVAPIEEEHIIKPEKKEEKREEETKRAPEEKEAPEMPVFNKMNIAGASRLIIFVVLAIALLLFVTKSDLGGSSSLSLLMILIVLVIFFAVGKGGEKHLFDDF